jgi:hypothetical protein
MANTCSIDIHKGTRSLRIKELDLNDDVRQVLIRCTVTGEGMFPTEVTVEIQTDAGPLSLYADRRLLSEQPTTSLKVTRMSVEKDFALCLLPVEDVDSRWVRIPAGDVHDAFAA